MIPTKSTLACLLAAALAGIQAAQATISVTNGDFETGTGNNIDTVTDWFDNSDGTFWHGTWQTNAAAISPNNTGVVVLGSYESGAVQGTASASPLGGNWLYQSIGTVEGGATELKVDFQFGQPDDDGGGRTLGVSVAIYAYNGTGTFVADDNTDLQAASLDSANTGITLLDSDNFQFGPTTVADQALGNYSASLNVSAAGSQTLFLRINNYRPAATQSWSVVDNVVAALVTTSPVFSVQPAAFTAGGVGGNVTLTASATANPAPTYQWQFSADGSSGWTNLTGKTSSTLTFDPAAYSDGRYYRVIASNVNNSVPSDTAQVSMSYPNPVITQQPAAAGAYLGSNVQFGVTATGLGTLTYQWHKVDVNGDNELAGETASTLQLNGISSADVASYYVVVFDSASVADEGSARQSVSAAADLTLVDVIVSASDTVPTTDASDQFYLPGDVNDVDNIDGSPGGVPNTAAATNDASTFVAFDRTSQGMTFTTGSNPGGYTISAVTLRHVKVATYLATGTFYDLQNSDNFGFQFGTVTGGVKTSIYNTSLAQYNGTALVTPAQPNNLGTGKYLTFDLSAAGIAALSPNTTYYFEVTAGTGSPYFELSGTSLDGYAGGTAFCGNTVATIDTSYNALAGDRAFHVNLAAVGGGNTYASWIAGYPGVGGQTGFNVDADGDGIRNGLENLFGTNPAVSSPGIVQVARSGNTVTFQHPQDASPASDISAAYVWSTDMTTFHASGEASGGTTVSLVAAPNTPTTGTTTVTATISGTVPSKLFLALKATR